jgi:hypothetical protein
MKRFVITAVVMISALAEIDAFAHVPRQAGNANK